MLTFPYFFPKHLELYYDHLKSDLGKGKGTTLLILTVNYIDSEVESFIKLAVLIEQRLAMETSSGDLSPVPSRK